MKKLYGILKTALWCFLGVFVGVTAYTCWDHHARPELYTMQSATWYTSIQVHAAFNVVVCGILFVVMSILKKKM